MYKKRCVTLLLSVALLLLALPTAAEMLYTVEIEASRDNTLIEDPDGARSNGSGPFIFVGRTADNVGGGIRRGLVHFDLEGVIPHDAFIESVALHLSLDRGGTEKVRLHRVLEDWGEGLSCSNGGRGAPSEAGDATWLHTFYDNGFWADEGGDFSGAVSAREKVDMPGDYVWSSNRIAKDVQFWLEHPEMNFGWILIGDEKKLQSVVAFVSRDPFCNGEPTGLPQPLLEVTYSLPDEE